MPDLGGGEIGGGEDLGADIGGGEPVTEPTTPPAGGGEGEVTPESFNRDDLKILLENKTMFSEDTYLDLTKGRNSLGKIEDELKKLLKD